ncbi:MAG: pyridoxal phosphate-dependent aminotransferase [Alphaproteobacteria bacterium]|nr:pyridoxal phosphate-dependent aminotransferase [Alphaproteobacteria bacterium]
MRYSDFTRRIGGKGANAWIIHERAIAAKRAGEPVIMLTIGDPDFDTPVAIRNAAHAALEAGDTHYPPIRGTPALRTALAAKLSRRYGRPVAPETLIVMPGAQNALFASALCLVGTGDEVVLLEPTYATYEATFRAGGATLVTVPLRPEHGFQPDLAEIAQAITPRTRAIVINSPHNPSGAVLPAATVRAIGDLAKTHDLWLISDEVYADQCFDVPFTSAGSLADIADRTVVVSSFSKSHAMTGWRIGWVQGPTALVDHLYTLSLAMMYGVPGFIQAAALAALGEDAAVADMREELRRRRDLVLHHLGGQNRVKVVKPDAGMFVMLDVRGTGLEPLPFAERLLEEERVSILPADSFGPSAAGHLRMALAVPADELGEACRRIVRFAGSLP